MRPEAEPRQLHAVWAFQWGTAALNLQDLSLRRTSQSALLIDLGTERNGSFFPVQLCLEN